VKLIKDSDRRLSQRDLPAKYKLSTDAVCNILKRQKNISMILNEIKLTKKEEKLKIILEKNYYLNK